MVQRRPDPDHEPIGTLNITPLIDVMLVLLVMFIIAVPAMTHKVPMNLPVPGPAGELVVHRLAIAADGALRWDGSPVAEAALAPRLAALVGDPDASLVLDPDGAARYERFDQVLATVRRAGVTRLGFADNARFAAFDAPAI
jgi:biopolymer transport protein ExbD